MLSHVTLPGPKITLALPPYEPPSTFCMQLTTPTTPQRPRRPGVNSVCQPAEGSMHLSPQSAWAFLASISMGRGHSPGLQPWEV